MQNQYEPKDIRNYQEPYLLRMLRGDPGKRKPTGRSLRKKNRIAAVLAGASWYLMTMIYNAWYTIHLDINQQATTNPFKAFGNALGENTFIAILILLLTAGTYHLVRKKIRKTEKTDPRGYRLNTESPEHRSRMMAEEEKHRMFDYLDYENPDGLIVAKSKETGELLTVPWELTYEDDGLTNLNVAVFGSPGTRKTSGIILGSFYSAIANGLSLAVTDPKGEIYMETYAAALKYGYNVKIFDVQPGNFDKSDGWDPIALIRNSAAPLTDAQIMSRIIFENTGQVDGFWDEAPMALLTAVLLYVAKGSGVESAYREHGHPSSNGNLRNMATVYDVVTDENMQKHMEEAIRDCEADRELYGQAFKNWASHSQKDTIQSDLGLRLSFLQNREVSRILSEDEIDFKDIAEQKTIIYIICSDHDMTYKAVLTLFTSFMFRKVIELADSYEKKKLPHLFYVILEEMSNCGRINGIGNLVATARSRGIFLMFCNQTIGALKSIYGTREDPYEWEKILGCCALQFCLSSGDLTTQEYFSRLSGQMSARTKMHARQVPTYSPFKIAMQERLTEMDKAVPVFTPDDIKKIKASEVAVFPAQHDPFLENKYFYKDHPLYRLRLFDNDGNEVIANHANHIPQWKKRLNQNAIAEYSQSMATITYEDESYTVNLIPKESIAVTEEEMDIFGRYPTAAAKIMADLTNRFVEVKPQKEKDRKSSHSYHSFLRNYEKEKSPACDAKEEAENDAFDSFEEGGAEETEAHLILSEKEKEAAPVEHRRKTAEEIFGCEIY